jgi:hypothetical protein
MISRGDGRGFRTSVIRYQTSATGRDERLENIGLRNTESSGSLTQIDSVAHVGLYMPVVRRETQKEWREKSSCYRGLSDDSGKQVFIHTIA